MNNYLQNPPVKFCCSCSEPLPVKGSTCVFSCDEGFELTGSAERVCQWDGYWSGYEASCISTVNCAC